MHSKDARARGETEQRLYGLNALARAPYYTERERAALEWTEAVTLVSETHVPDEVFAKVARAVQRRRDLESDAGGRGDQRLESLRDQFPSCAGRVCVAVWEECRVDAGARYEVRGTCGENFNR